MITPESPGTHPEEKPPWQTPAAAAGAMAAGLMAGRKGAMSLALGVAAVAGAKWLLKRKKREEAPQRAALPEVITPTANLTPAPQPALPKFEAPAELVTAPPMMAAAPSQPQQPVESVSSSSVLVYEQGPVMPSCSSVPTGNVWFALFNEAPLVSVESPPPPDVASTSESLVEPVTEPQMEFDLVALPEAFFNEAPNHADPLEEGSADDGSHYAESEMAPVLSEFELERVEVASVPAHAARAEIAIVAEPAPLSPPLPSEENENPEGRQIVPKAAGSVLERVARPTSSTALPQKRAEGEAPKSWIVPQVDPLLGPQPKRMPTPHPASHRRLMPHEALESTQGPRRWPLVAAAMALLLVLLAVVMVGTGMDGGMVSQWRLRWLNFHPHAAVDQKDIGLWTKEAEKTATASTAGK